MVLIKKTGEGTYKASLQETVDIIDRHSGYHLKKEVGKIIGSQRVIEINFQGVRQIDKAGLSMLMQLLILAEKKKCKLRFTGLNSGTESEIKALINRTIISNN